MIKRDDVQRRIVIQSSVEDRDMGFLVRELHSSVWQYLTVLCWWMRSIAICEMAGEMDGIPLKRLP